MPINNNKSRENILKKLENNKALPIVKKPQNYQSRNQSQNKFYSHDFFIKNLEKNGTKIYQIKSENLGLTLKEIKKTFNLANIAYNPQDYLAPKLQKYQDELNLISSDTINKEKMFNNIEASICSSEGGISEFGALIFKGNEKEVLSLSLVPPVHIALLDRNNIYFDLKEAQLDWQAANLIFISGPSRTSDIEMTLSLGVHGPKILIVIIMD